MRTFSVFVSSPSDVMIERRRLEKVISRLNAKFAGAALLNLIRWESEFYQAYSSFQPQVPRSTECDLVIAIFKWRLGTPLPPDFAETLPDHRPYPSGVAFELLTAMEKRWKGEARPDIYVFRFNGPAPSITLDDPNREEIERNWRALQAFFQEWFLGYKSAFTGYNSLDDFEKQVEDLLSKWLAEKVPDSAGGHTFVSYSSHDETQALDIVTRLEASAIKCWIACRDVPAGEDFQDAIVSALEKANAMVLVFSKNADNSIEIKKELALASENKLFVLPVRIENTFPTKGFKYQLATRQYIDLFENRDHNMTVIVDALKKHLRTVES